jgi:hypothetical protein
VIYNCCAAREGKEVSVGKKLAEGSSCIKKVGLSAIYLLSRDREETNTKPKKAAALLPRHCASFSFGLFTSVWTMIN